MTQHNWIPSTLGHGETMCSRCFVTNREASALGITNECDVPESAPPPANENKPEEIAATYKVDYWNCGGEGEIEGDCTCGEDCCCCLEPEPPTCSECRGRGFLVVSELTDDNCDSAVKISDSALGQ